MFEKKNMKNFFFKENFNVYMYDVCFEKSISNKKKERSKYTVYITKCTGFNYIFVYLYNF